MDALAIHYVLTARGAVLTTDGERLTVTPAAVLDDELRQEIKAHKPELLRLLADLASPPPPLDLFGGTIPAARDTSEPYAGRPTPAPPAPPPAPSRRTVHAGAAYDPALAVAYALTVDDAVEGAGVRQNLLDYAANHVPPAAPRLVPAITEVPA